MKLHRSQVFFGKNNSPFEKGDKGGLKVYRFLWYIIFLFILCSCLQKDKQPLKPNILFIMMDDLGYGQFGIYNDTITTEDFNPYFVSLVDSLQGYSLDRALEFSKSAIPTITKLAKGGVIFTNAYASSNLCAPSRVGIATGTLQNRWGIYTNSDCEQHGIVPGTHLVEKLKEKDYKTAHIGKWHIGRRNAEIIQNVLKKNGIEEKLSYNKVRSKYPGIFEEIEEQGYFGSVIDKHHPLKNGFDYYYGYNNWASQFYNSTYVWENFEHAGKQKGYNTDVFTSKALEFMQDQIAGEHPFYVQIHYHAVHDSLEPKAPPVYFDKFDSDSYDLNNFFAHIYGVDYNIKRIVDFLKSKGQYENTLIFFTSDNGAMCGGKYDGHKTGSPLPGNTPFSGHKGNYYQGGFRIPMFMHWPDGINTPQVRHQLVSTMDILPTAIDIAGGKLPEKVDGKSLIPLIQRNTAKIHDQLIWSGIHSSTWGYLITKTSKHHGNERPFAPPAWVIIKNDYLLRFVGTYQPGLLTDYMEGKEPVVELYNIKNDPAELVNIADEQPERVKEMAKIYFKESKDFPPPVSWKKEKWKELVGSKAFFE